MMSYNKALPLPVTHTQLLAFNLNQFLRGHLVVTPVQWAGVPLTLTSSFLKILSLLLTPSRSLF